MRRVQDCRHFCNQLHQIQTSRKSRSQADKQGRELWSAWKDPEAGRDMDIPGRQWQRADSEDEPCERSLVKGEGPAGAEPGCVALLKIWAFLQEKILSTRGT